MTKQEMLKQIANVKQIQPVNQLPEDFQNWTLAEILRFQQVVNH